MNDTPPLQIAIVGAASCTGDEELTAEEVGRQIAQAGAVLICGGRGGVMEAACRGATGAGGIAVGILPGGMEEANPFCTVTIPTGLGIARNAVVVSAAGAVIAVGGAYGTLSEIAMALKLGCPVFGIQTWKIPGVVACMDAGEAVARAVSTAGRDTGNVPKSGESQ
ncbi:TIGR00725 family protein [Methanogenium organophilum]|uniref:TIGR00725 family protein n=1 Tax=Methanogenium organophilum TaxID=2199 RepID=A0A9X9S4X6_METOG|nr:TIGR00725 family protein [Methanogenium organophilum]WAI02099.1 TIGR00725 family protein [Methanogenium organophilum]